HLRDAARCAGVTGRLALLALIGAWVLVRLLAAVSPPDPTWVAGVYDDDDFDDVVVFIGSLVGVSDVPAPTPARLDWTRPRLSLPRPSPPLSVKALPLLDRSPPQS